MESAELRTYRPTWAPIAGGAWIAFSTLLLVDLLRRGTAQQIVVGMLVVGACDLVAYLFGLQPCVVQRPDGLEIVNPLRRVRLRWTDIRDLYVRDVLIVVTDTGPLRCAGITGALPSSQGRRLMGMRMFPGAPQAPAETEPKGAREVVEQLTRRWEDAGGPRSGPPVTPSPPVEWYPPSVTLLAVAVVMLVGAVVLGR